MNPSSGVQYGHVIAILMGYAFGGPVKDVFREINEASKASMVQMPTQFDLLAS